MISEPIYKYDSHGNMRSWQYEVVDNAWRSITGVIGGKTMISGWKYVDRGRSQDSANEQALFDAERNREVKLEKEFYETQEAAKEKKPKLFQCMLAAKYDPALLSFPCEVQPKLDGIRCIITSAGAFTRNGKDINSIPHILEELEPWFEENPDSILDGELYNHDLHDDFQGLVSVIRKTKCRPEDLELSRQIVEYHIYDVPGDETSTITRMKSLKENLTSFKSIRFVETQIAQTQDDVDAAHEEYLERNFEGSMIRLPGSYENKRSRRLLKRKEFDTEEFRIVEVLEGQGNWAGCAKHFCLEDKETGKRFNSGVRGTMEFLRVVLTEKDEYVEGDATVRFFGRSNTGVPRFPVTIDISKGERND